MHAISCVSQWFYRRSQQNHDARVRVLQKVISHSNILKAALPRSRWKCGSGEGPKHVFDVSDFFLWSSTKIKNMHQACTRSIFLNAPNMVESRIHSLVRLSSVFCKTLRETATRQWIVNPALFRVCANVPLVSVLSTFLFSSIFVESEYATFSMVRAPHANSAIKKALFIVSDCNNRSATAGFCSPLPTKPLQEF